MDKAQEILLKVRQRLDASVYPEVRHIQCGVRKVRLEEYTVVLSGRVSSFYMKQVAQEAIRNGCVITNELEVVSNPPLGKDY